MIIHESPLPDVVIPDIPMTEYVLRHAAVVPDRVAMMDGPTGRSYTYGQLAGAIHALAGGLAARGFGPGSTIALMAPNIPEYAIVFHGSAVAGVTLSTINPTYTPEEVRIQLIDSGATMLVTIEMFLGTAREAIQGTDVDTIVLIGGQGEDTLSLTDLLAESIEQVEVDLTEHIVVLPYSSGTTGLPKGVMLTHRNLVANLVQIEPGLAVGEDEVGLAVLPFFHIYGMQVVMNGMLAAGATVITMPRFDLEQALTLIQENQVTRFPAVPPIVLALAKHPLVDQFDLSSLSQVFSGAAPLGAEVAAEAAARIGCEVVQGYGMTELSPVTQLTPVGNYKPGTVGVTVGSTACRIVDPATGEDLDVGGEGELWIKGPQVMKGYLNNPEATETTIDREGWLHTGDIAVIDSDGHVSIVDRLKELIKVKGFQVAPAELEAVLLTHPGIADAAVIGVPDDEAGEVPRAYVVAKPGQDLDPSEITAFLTEHLATYKVVHDIVLTAEIPKSASGKILRRVLRDQANA